MVYHENTPYFIFPTSRLIRLLPGWLYVSLASAFYLFTKRKSLYDRLFLLGAIAFIAFVLVLSDSRVSWLACIAGILFIIFNARKGFSGVKTKFRNKIVYALSSIALVSIIAGRLYFYKKDSVEARLLIWTVSKDIICDAPVAGHGINSFPAIYELSGGIFRKGAGFCIPEYFRQQHISF